MLGSKCLSETILITGATDSNGTREVFIDSQVLNFRDSFHYKQLDANSFSWGNFDQGTYQLAFAILLEIGGLRAARNHYNDFTKEFLVHEDADSAFSIQLNIHNWIVSKNKTLV